MNPWLIRFIHFVTAHAPCTLIAHVMRIRFPPQVSALPKNWCTCHDNVPSLYPGVVVSSKVTAPTPLLVRHWSFCLTTFFVSLSVLSQIPIFSCCLFSVFPRYFFSSFFCVRLRINWHGLFSLSKSPHSLVQATSIFSLFEYINNGWKTSPLVVSWPEWGITVPVIVVWVTDGPSVRVESRAMQAIHWFSQCHARSVSGLWLPGHIMDAPL